MTDSEIFPFMDVLRDVIRVFPIRGDEHDVKQLGTAYFKALRRYPLSLVQAGAERCIEHGKHFPKPAEWLDAIPRATTGVATLAALTESERDDWTAAEHGRWEQSPCRCSECRFAGMQDRPQRFVPIVDASGGDVRALIGDRTVTRGRWIHGQELARWYAAKDQFWVLFRSLMAAKTMGVRAVREPGEDDE